jgi:hypothetical protein
MRLIAGGNNSFKKCYPFEYKSEPSLYEYRDNASAKLTLYATHPNIRFFSQDNLKGKTLEYELALNNPTLDLLLTNSISNKEEIQELMNSFKNGKTLDQFSLRKSDENLRIETSIKSDYCKWEEVDKKKAIIASRYLNSVEKGENALELSINLENDFDSASAFVVPPYLKDAIEWLFQ